MNRNFNNQINQLKNIIGNGEQNTSKSLIPILISEIDENPINEETFNMDGISELADYIKEVGYHAPIIVFQKPDGRYEVSAGHRRLRAKKQIGDMYIDAYVEPMPESHEDVTYRMVMENLQNRKLLPLDEARAMKLIKDIWIPSKRKSDPNFKGDTKDIIASMFKTSSTKVSRTLQLLDLIPELQKKVDEKIISVDAAIQLLRKENVSYDGLQQYVNKVIEEKYLIENEGNADSEDNEIPKGIEIVKDDIVRIINTYKKQFVENTKKEENANNSSATRKKVLSYASKFSKIIDSPVQIESDDIEVLIKLRDKLNNLIENSSSE